MHGVPAFPLKATAAEFENIEPGARAAIPQKPDRINKMNRTEDVLSDFRKSILFILSILSKLRGFTATCLCKALEIADRCAADQTSDRAGATQE